MSNISDEIASSTILSIILGFPILIGIGIIAVPFVIISGIIGVPIATLIKSLLVFGVAVFFVWLFSKHQIIENGIVGLIVGSLVYSHFKIHPIFCILIGLCIIGLLFLISGFNIGFWLKAVIFSTIISFFIWGAFYSKSGLLPAQDNIWSISFFIIFFLENIYIRLSIRYDLLEINSALVKENKEQKMEQTVSDNFTASAEKESLPLSKENKSYSAFKIEDSMINLFNLKNKFWDSEAEPLVYDALKVFINEDYVIVPHVAFREILKWDWKYDLRLNDKVNAMHFDFVIHNKDQHVNCPALVVEVWGSEHFTDQKIKERDEFKQAVLKRAGVKNIIIDLSQSMSDQNVKEKTIECVKKEIPSREHYTVYCPLCSSVMEIKTNSITAKEFYGCRKYNRDKEEYSCKGSRNIVDVPPLYNGIKIKDEKHEENKTTIKEEGKTSYEK